MQDDISPDAAYALLDNWRKERTPLYAAFVNASGSASFRLPKAYITRVTEDALELYGENGGIIDLKLQHASFLQSTEEEIPEDLISLGMIHFTRCLQIVTREAILLLFELSAVSPRTNEVQ